MNKYQTDYTDTLDSTAEKGFVKYPRHESMIMKGNFAAAEAAKLCRAGFIPAYPITPQTSIVEQLSEKVSSGKMDATYINMDSEHSVFAAAMGAAIVGERVFTATSGQGLFYAHEVLHAIAHFRLPMVVCNVGRPSIPWNIWSDQSDSLSQRDTGWIQFYGESSQEVLDTIIQSYIISEKLEIPVMVVLDAFYQSHTSENIWVPEQSLVDEFLPKKKLTGKEVNAEEPIAIGGLIPPEHYEKFNYAFWKDMNTVENLSTEVSDRFEKHFGRKYQNVEAVNIGPHTKTVLVTMSSLSTTAKGVIRKYPEVGLLKLRLFKPFPKKSVNEALKELPGDAVIACVERNFMGDHFGAIMQEMKRALYSKNYTMYDFYAGVGGKDVSPITIEKILYKIRNRSSADKVHLDEVNWIDIEN
ncbi:MAG TPA: pyruvate ferredoxin oxidoreductase [Cytophagales bacterium]|mgnify:FL=1|jgi:2-oxoisovalerate ferredoxin oxidoreductase alpha subunit|nr:pyruvate ferredoxin oxidoreductase [Cytophagales bacterium]